MDIGGERNRQDLIEVFQMYKGFTKLKMVIIELFTKDSNVQGTGGHTLKLEKPGCIEIVGSDFSHTG